MPNAEASAEFTLARESVPALSDIASLISFALDSRQATVKWSFPYPHAPIRICISRISIDPQRPFSGVPLCWISEPDHASLRVLRHLRTLGRESSVPFPPFTHSFQNFPSRARH